MDAFYPVKRGKLNEKQVKRRKKKQKFWQKVAMCNVKDIDDDNLVLMIGWLAGPKQGTWVSQEKGFLQQILAKNRCHFPPTEAKKVTANTMIEDKDAAEDTIEDQTSQNIKKMKNCS